MNRTPIRSSERNAKLRLALRHLKELERVQAKHLIYVAAKQRLDRGDPVESLSNAERVVVYAVSAEQPGKVRSWAQQESALRESLQEALLACMT